MDDYIFYLIMAIICLLGLLVSTIWGAALYADYKPLFFGFLALFLVGWLINPGLAFMAGIITALLVWNYK